VTDDRPRFDTRAVSGEAADDYPAGDVVPPIHLSTTFARERMADDPEFDYALGGMLAFEIAGGEAAAATALDALRHVRLAVSLGGVGSLIAHVLTMTHYYLDTETRERMGISDPLIRMSTGIEDPADIVADLERGLDRA